MAVDKLNLNTGLIKLEDKHTIFNEFAKQNNKFPYREFLEIIGKFEFDSNKIYSDMRQNSEPNQAKDPQYETYLQKLRDQNKEPEFSFFKSKNLPISSLHQVYQDTLKIKRFLKNYFPDKQKFDEFI